MDFGFSLRVRTPFPRFKHSRRYSGLFWKSVFLRSFSRLCVGRVENGPQWLQPVSLVTANITSVSSRRCRRNKILHSACFQGTDALPTSKGDPPVNYFGVWWENAVCRGDDNCGRMRPDWVLNAGICFLTVPVVDVQGTTFDACTWQYLSSLSKWSPLESFKKIQLNRNFTNSVNVLNGTSTLFMNIVDPYGPAQRRGCAGVHCFRKN